MYYYNLTEPNSGDLVFAKIIKVEDLGIKIQLVEYDNKEGYILYTNLQKKKKVDINRLYKINKEIIIESNGMFENILSFTDKNMDQDEIKKFEVNFKKYTRIINLINSFLKINKDINNSEFLKKVLFIDSDDKFDIIKKYEKCIKNNEIEFDLDHNIKKSYLEYLKKHIIDTKYKGIIKYETYSVNSCGLAEIKSFYNQVNEFAKSNDINIDIRIESLPNYLIIFDDDKFNESLEIKMKKLMEYINGIEKNFSHKLISNIIYEE